MCRKASGLGRTAGREITRAGNTGDCTTILPTHRVSLIHMSAGTLPGSPAPCLQPVMVPHRLWTDEDNYNLIKDHYAWFLDTYESLPKPVMKADSARYLYMYHIGGSPLLCQMPTCCRLEELRVPMIMIPRQARTMVCRALLWILHEDYIFDTTGSLVYAT